MQKEQKEAERGERQMSGESEGDRERKREMQT